MSTLLPAIARLDLVAVGDVMHAGVIGCDPAAPLAGIASVLAREQIHCVIVSRVEHTPSGERIAWGAISATDLVRALDASDTSVTAERLASDPIVTVDPDDSVARAVQLMAEHDTAHLVVVRNDFPVGILSALDVARAASGR